MKGGVDIYPRPIPSAQTRQQKFHPTQPRIPVRVISKGCPHCGGTLIHEPGDRGEPELTCINCARTFYPKEFLK